MALQALRASNADIAFTSALADSWVASGDALAILATADEPYDSVLRRIVSQVGRTRVHATLRAFAAIWAARRAAGLDAPTAPQVASLSRVLLRMAFRDPIALADLALTGDDLRRAGIPAGPMMGRILHDLLDRVLDDPTLNTHDQLLALAQQRITVL